MASKIYRNHSRNERCDRNSTLQVFLGVIGIFFLFLAAGAAHEKLYAFVGEDEETFDFSVFLVLVWCISNSILSAMLLHMYYGINVVDHVKSMKTSIHKELFFASLTYVTSLVTSNYALTLVNFPTQVLVKSAKTIPIVIGGYLQYRKVYPWQDYVGVFAITAGLVLFNFDKMSGTAESHNTGLGLFLLAISLICDGMTGPRQDNVLKLNPNLRAASVMLVMNLFASAVCLPAFLWLEHVDVYFYILKNPVVISYVFLFAITSAIGQLCVFIVLTSVGSLYLAIITTIRKFVSIVCSVILYNHSLIAKQWLSVFVIFGALVMQTYQSRRKHQCKVAVKKVDICNEAPGLQKKNT